MYEKRIAKAYVRDLAGAIALYALVLTAALRLGRSMPEGALRTLVLICPMIGFGAIIWAIARHLGRIDEYQRRRILETVALAAAFTTGVTFTYGFFESAGFPRLSMVTVWYVLCVSIGAVNLVRKLIDK